MRRGANGHDVALLEELVEATTAGARLLPDRSYACRLPVPGNGVQLQLLQTIAWNGELTHDDVHERNR